MGAKLLETQCLWLEKLLMTLTLVNEASAKQTLHFRRLGKEMVNGL